MNVFETSTTLLCAVASLFLVAACGGATTPAPAEPGDPVAAGDEAPPAAAPRVPDVLIAFAPCTDDYRSLCAEVDPDDGAAVIACLRGHDTVLDRHCLAALDPEAPESRSTRCVAAISQMCPDADDPDSRTACIREFRELEPICRRHDPSPAGGPQGGGGPAGQGMGGGMGGGGPRR